MLKKVFVLRVVSFFISSYFVVKKANRLIGFDIIHLHNPSLIAPDVYTLHSIHTEGVKFQESNFKWYEKILFRIRTCHPVVSFISKFNYTRSKHLVAISKQIKAEVLNVNKSIPSEKISIIYHGVNGEDFKVSDRNKKYELLSKLGLNTQKKTILFVANEFKRKGLDILLEAVSEMKHLGDVNLVVVGESNDGYLSTQQAKLMAEDLGISKQCFFVGKSNDVGNYFSIADIFVLPTIYEPLGMVYMEAMAAGVPVLVSKIAGMADLIEHQKDGILISAIPSEITMVLDELFEAPDYFKSISSAGQKKMEKYSWQFSAQEYEKLYRTIK